MSYSIVQYYFISIEWIGCILWMEMLWCTLNQIKQFCKYFLDWQALLQLVEKVQSSFFIGKAHSLARSVVLKKRIIYDVPLRMYNMKTSENECGNFCWIRLVTPLYRLSNVLSVVTVLVTDFLFMTHIAIKVFFIDFLRKKVFEIRPRFELKISLFQTQNLWLSSHTYYLTNFWNFDNLLRI